ncbi:MAG: tRNA lysidine(34) synthetase TilS [Gluconacetobacter diazotrophicus]|nr:tRNA lysidine(34) synthetase TilS [Gluconacetobacter diazotrophicus]
MPPAADPDDPFPAAASLEPPVGAGEFAALMAPLGPWPPFGTAFPLPVAVSGGADSTALVLLAADWAAARGAVAHALVVDHRLRPDSAAEASRTVRRLRSHGIPSRLLVLSGLEPGPGVGERARHARHAALDVACRELGALELLLGHHRRDQAETVAMRQRAGSGPDGLSGMARIAETAGGVRRLRPLLGLDPARLRATLRLRAVDWEEDPGNRDERFERARLRRSLGPAAIDRFCAAADRHGAERECREAAAAGWLARHAVLRPEGFALLRPSPPDDPPPPGALDRLVRCVSGAPYPTAAGAAVRLFAAPSGATLGGVVVAPAGRLGPGRIVAREFAAVAPPSPSPDPGSHPPPLWDRRFAVSVPFGAGPLVVGALGDDRPPGVGSRTHRLPAIVLRTLPAFRRNGLLHAVPHLGWQRDREAPPPSASFRPAVAASGGGVFRIC